MQLLKLIYLPIIQLAKRVRSLPKLVTNAHEQTLQQLMLDELETERLDRIRNPSKYRGK